MYINVPGGAEVRYTGMKLDSTYRSGSGKYEGPCAEFEDPAKLPITEIYNVGEGYGTIMPTVTLGDTDLSLIFGYGRSGKRYSHVKIRISRFEAKQCYAYCPV